MYFSKKLLNTVITGIIKHYPLIREFMNHKDWSSIVNLHYGNLRQREELREYLENCWINAREYHGNRGTSSEDAYWAMEELYQYLASQEGGEPFWFILHDDNELLDETQEISR